MSYSFGTIGSYDASSGTTINSSFVSGLFYPLFVAISGHSLYAVNQGNNGIGKYNASTGAAINTHFISGLNFPAGVAVSGNNLYVANWNTHAVALYDANSGAIINPLLVSGLNGPEGIAISGDALYVANYWSGTIGEYDANTGAPVNVSLVTGLIHPVSIAVVPEPASELLSALGLVFLANRWRKGVNHRGSRRGRSAGSYYPINTFRYWMSWLNSLVKHPRPARNEAEADDPGWQAGLNGLQVT